jgi:Cu-Zn family superoxide dismutase
MRQALLLVTATVLTLAAVTVVSAQVGNADTVTTTTDASAAKASIRDVNGNTVGTLTILSKRSSVVVTASVSRQTAGFHGFHIHTTGICDPTTTDASGNPSPFLTAGAHFNPGAATHGSHAGDLPALLVVTAGSAQAVVETDRFTVADLLDADGSAVIVHALPDNLANIPTRYVSSTTGLPGPDTATLGTGDSGGRVACGVIRRL